MYPSSTGSWAFKGRIDEFRFSKGIARWTGSFTPPVFEYGTSAPEADFAVSASTGAAPLTVHFTDTSSGTVTSWLWDFEDGTTSSAQNPAHSFLVAGSYTISLTADGPAGSDSEMKTNYINVTEAPPPVPGIDQYTKLLLQGNGENGGTVITDSSDTPHTPSTATGVVTSTTQIKYGSASLSFNSGYVRYAGAEDWYLAGEQDFTIDAWVYNTNGSQSGICGTLTSSNTQWGFTIHGNQLRFYSYGWLAVSSTQVPLNQWTHVAVVRYQGTIRLYINGLQSGTTSTTSFSDVAAPNFIVGDMYPNNTGPWAFKGFIDELRVSKGIARWTGNFTPPASEYGH
ncbi:MAG: LamG-like jellyroll fold domain-containing protein [Syntrophobacteraceae bacterium]